MDFLSTALQEIGFAMKPLVDGATSGDVEDFASTFRQVGIPLDEVMTEAEIQGLAEGIAAIGSLLGDDPAPLDALTAINNIGETLEALQEEVPDVDVMNLVDFFIIQQIQRRAPLLHNVLVLLGVIIIRRVEPPESLIPYVLWRINWAGLSELFQDPAVLLRDAYNWGGDDLDADKLLLNLRNVFWMLRIPAGLQEEDQDSVRGLLGDGSNDPMLRVPALYFQTDPGVWVEAGCAFLPYRRDLTKGFYGLALAPYGVAELGQEIDLGSGWTLKVSAGAGGVLGYGVKFSPDSGLELGALDGGAGGDARFNIKLGLFKGSDTGTRVVVFGEEGGSRLEVGKVGVGTGLEVAIGEQGHWFIEGVLERGQIVVANKDSDGFLAKILPPDGFTAPFDLVVGWATDQGLYFEGSAALEVTLPVHKELGPLRIDSVYLRLGINAEGKLEVALAAAVGAELGPISASVDRIGADLKTTLERSPQFTYGFVPPTGAGLSVDAGGIVGGGYLDFDPDNERYAGILQLSFGEIELMAIGLITTRMPDGSRGFSMLLIITAEFDPPITLPYNFNLSGVGGLIGIHRTMLVDVIRQGIKNRTVDSILFPEDPILNAPRIISDLRAVFPPTEGRYVIGPMAIINWGSPPLIRAEIGILIEIPSPVRIAILGQLTLELPKGRSQANAADQEDDRVLVEIHLDLLGIVDFDKKTFSFDATLYDSRIAKFTLSGDSAMRLSWGDNPNFTLSVGGLHPRFTPPPNFPTLKRLQLSLGSGNNPRISLNAYMAVTSNSTQFGASLEVYASKGAFKLHGYMGFDVLFIFSPFSFMADIGAGVEVKKGSRTLLSVTLDLALSGPKPWNARGKATFKVLFVKVKVRFDKTWGSGRPDPLSAIDPWPRLRAALDDPGNWGARLPIGSQLGVTLRGPDDAVSGGSGTAPGVAVLHPMGALEIRQRVLPFNLEMDLYGNAPIAGDTSYSVAELWTGPGEPDDSNSLDINYDKEQFARAQFESLSDSEKLSLPSFEKFDAAILSGTGEVSSGTAVNCPLEYETEVIDENRVTHQAAEDQPQGVSWDAAQYYLKGGAAQVAAARMTGLQAYAPLGEAKKVILAEEDYKVVRTADLALETNIKQNGNTLTHAEASRLLRDYLAANPGSKGQLQVVPSYEVVV